MQVEKFVNGVRVTEEEWQRQAAERAKRDGNFWDAPPRAANCPEMHSTALQFVAADQARQFQDNMRREGISVEIDRDLRPVFTSLHHQRRVLKALGWVNFDDN